MRSGDPKRFRVAGVSRSERLAEWSRSASARGTLLSPIIEENGFVGYSESFFELHDSQIQVPII